MKTNLTFIISLAIGTLNIHAQNADPSSTSAPKNLDNQYSSLSLYGGYGKHGVNFRLDLQIAEKHSQKSSTRLYLELGGQGITFDQPNFNFAHVEYPSDCRLISFGGGIAQEFLFNNRFSLTPFIGLRNEYVRFKNSALVDAIGTSGLVRYTDNTYTTQIGPVVKNAYGDASSFDIGSRLGIRLGKRRVYELSATIGYSPIVFDTADTLFGQYRGQAPYENPFWVKRNPLRYELGLRFNFND